MEFKWLVISKNPSKITKDFENDEFVSFENIDLSFIPNDIISIQYDSYSNNSFIQKIINENIIEEPIQQLEDIPYLNQIIELLEEKLEEIIEPSPTYDDLMVWLRNIREKLLQEADIVIIRAFESGTVAPESWVNYRQQLRDLPQQIELGNIPAPTYETQGTYYVPEYIMHFNHWPVKPQ